MFEPTEIIVIWPQLFNFDGICEHIACAMWTAIFDVAHKNTEVKFGIVHAISVLGRVKFPWRLGVLSLKLEIKI